MLDGQAVAAPTAAGLAALNGPALSKADAGWYRKLGKRRGLGQVNVRIADLISRLMLRLAPLPGLSFLQTYVQSARGMKTRFGQRKGDYEAYLAAGRGAIDEVGNEVGGPREKGSGRQAAEGEGGYDYDDQYDYDESDSFSSDSMDYLEDDYPASDENNTYYDDDYKSY